MKSPRLYLAIDNCFASKRWTRPDDWTALIRGLGLRYIEASADNEADPLYSGAAAHAQWVRSVQDACGKHDTIISNLYSGHGTYSTLGLAHYNPDVRTRMREHWMKPMMNAASELSCGLGFYCHAFDGSILQSPDAYEKAKNDLIRELVEITAYWNTLPGGGSLSLEQMYTPHQIPWTLTGTTELMQRLFADAGPCYTTVDTGHQVGQRKFLMPDQKQILQSLRSGEPDIWLGPERCKQIAREVRAGTLAETDGLRKIKELIDAHPYLFAHPEDGDPYQWLRRLGTYSPIIHLQQTDGTRSAHLPFNPEQNERGIIHGEKLLRTLEESYMQPADDSMPPRCDEIYLTLELFFSTDSYPQKILHAVQDSVDYWRGYIPEDGITLADAIRRIPPQRARAL